MTRTKRQRTEEEQERDRWVTGRMGLDEVLSREGLSIYCLFLKPGDAGSPDGTFPPYPCP